MTRRVCVRRGWRWGRLALAVLALASGTAAAQGKGIQVENITWVTGPWPLDQGEEACERLRDTLASLPESPRQTVRLGSGGFSCGEKPLVVPDHVVLEGSGRGWAGTRIVGYVDNSVWGVVHLVGQATLSRLEVRSSGSNDSVAVSAFDDTFHIGSPKLIDVVLVSNSDIGSAYPLVVIGKDVEARSTDFYGGNIRLLGGGYAFTLFGGTLRGIDADETVTAKCYFYRSWQTNAAVVGPACP